MPATIFWYKSDTAANSNEKFLSREQNNYNKYVNRYNSVIEYYNKFIENVPMVGLLRATWITQ